MKRIILTISLLVFISGCIINAPAATSEGVSMKLSASPPQVFAGRETTLYIDVENKNQKAITDIESDAFDKGMLLGSCKGEIDSMEKNEFKTFICRLSAPRADMLPESRIDNAVWTKVSYDNSLAAAQVTKIISQNEFEIRQRTGKDVKESRSFAYSDKNIELLVEFSNDLPLVAGRKEFVYFTVKNIGNGFLSNVRISLDSSVLSNDCKSRNIDVIGKTSPRFACELLIEKEINYLSSPTIIINIDYNYEVRNTLTIPIIK